MNTIKLRLQQVVITSAFFCCFAFNFPPPDKESVIKSKGSAGAVNDSVNIKANIVAFLRWYKTNLNKAASFPLLSKDSQDYFMVNRKACTAYLAFLKSSKYISTKYIGYWQRYFDDKAADLKKEKIRSDVPEGFDMDFVLITQEPELILDAIDSLKLTVVSMNRTMAVIGVILPSDTTVDYEFEMAKTKQGWQINYISTQNFD
jgi:hypothetical protein